MPIQCTDAEWKILEVLWDQSPRTIAEITKTLEPSTGWTRHTVITLLKRMEEKGTVKVDESGPAKTYTPAVSQDAASTEQTRKFLSHVFRGDASLLINHLVSSGDLTVEDMQEIIDAMKKAPRG
ncbi:MAG: BlaI/MecI/CopY family transcriptional regulator [Clostridia bacterium]|nr:BlaI/MecI/CopY family transcriptional regulator [Clostridia bacterium]